MTTTESPQGQPVPTEPIDGEWIVGLDEKMAAIQRINMDAIHQLMLMRSALPTPDAFTRRLAAQPSGATVSRGDVKAVMVRHIKDWTGLYVESVEELVDNIMLELALSTPTETPAPPLTDRLRDGFLPIILSWMGCDQESAEDFADELLAVVNKETT